MEEDLKALISLIDKHFTAMCDDFEKYGFTPNQYLSHTFQFVVLQTLHFSKKCSLPSIKKAMFEEITKFCEQVRTENGEGKKI